MKNKKKVFLVGVGGIGMSSLAKYLYLNKYILYGQDDVLNKNIKHLVKNYQLKFFQNKKKIKLDKDFDYLIYSPAVASDNLIRKEARKLKIKEFSYPEFLGKISEEKFTISISGTNGKTTTTTMVAEILDYFKKDPTIIVGGISRKFNSNFLAGKSDLFVVESCEYKNSFLNLKPNIIAITNITPDHLDYFENFQNYQKAFENFLEKVKGDKKILICNKESKNLKKILKKAKKLKFRIIDYKKYQIKEVSVPGEYNRENAQIALAVADIFNLDLEKTRKYLAKDFVGSGKRFEYLGKTKTGLKVYDDYAHNPEALSALVFGIKEKFSNKKNIIIFQPHLFSRTEDFFNGFINSISKFDIIYILPIYQARENLENFSINSKMLFKKIQEKNKNIFFCQDFKKCQKKVEEKKYDDNFVLFTVGGGNVSIIAKNLLK